MSYLVMRLNNVAFTLKHLYRHDENVENVSMDALDPDAEPDHRGSVSVYLRELAVKDQRAKEDESV